MCARKRGSSGGPWEAWQKLCSRMWSTFGMTETNSISREEFYLVLKQEEKLYDFVRIWQGDDESLYVSFVGVDQSQNHWSGRLCFETNEEGELIPRIIDIPCNTENAKEYRISYHTTGAVKYHGFNSNNQILEPLFKIASKNHFFSICVSEIEYLNEIGKNWEARKSQRILDITAYKGDACDFLFSIVPIGFSVDNNSVNSIVIDYGLFGLLIEIVEDSKGLKCRDIMKSFNVLSLIPHIHEDGKRQEYCPNEAFLKYEHILYKNNDVIILPPDEKGRIKIIFPVEMRRKPWIKIEFMEKGYKVIPKDVMRYKTKITFMVRDKAGNTVVDVSKIHIMSVELDSEIYDNESIAPDGFF